MASLGGGSFRQRSRRQSSKSCIEEIRSEHQPWLDRLGAQGTFRQSHSLLVHPKEGRPVTAPFRSQSDAVLMEKGSVNLEGDYVLEYSSRDRPNTSPEPRRRPHYLITERTSDGETRFVVAGLDDSLSPTSRERFRPSSRSKSVRSDRSSILSTTSRLTTASETERKREQAKEYKRVNSSLHGMMTAASKLWKANHNKPATPSFSQQSLQSDTDEQPVKVPTPELSRLSGWRSGLMSRVLLEEPVAFRTSSKQRVPVYSACTADRECRFTTKPLKSEASHVEIGMSKAPSSFSREGKTPAVFGMSRQAQRPYRMQDMTTVILGTSISFPSMDYPVHTNPPPRLDAIRGTARGHSHISGFQLAPAQPCIREAFPPPSPSPALEDPRSATSSPLPGTWRKLSESEPPDLPLHIPAANQVEEPSSAAPVLGASSPVLVPAVRQADPAGLGAGHDETSAEQEQEAQGASYEVGELGTDKV